MQYTVVLTPDATKGGSVISVRVPAMPGVFTWGATRDEALASAREAIELYLEQYVERGQPFPRDRKTLAGLGRRRGPDPLVTRVTVVPPTRSATEISRRSA